MSLLKEIVIHSTALIIAHCFFRRIETWCSQRWRFAWAHPSRAGPTRKRHRKIGEDDSDVFARIEANSPVQNGQPSFGQNGKRRDAGAIFSSNRSGKT